jgi:hypothetical protein
MKVSRQDFTCAIVLGVMILLAATASLVSMSYDSDDRDDAPPVTVELKFLLQSSRTGADIRTSAITGSPNFLRESHSTTRVADVGYASPQLEKDYSQLLIPLLC